MFDNLVHTINSNSLTSETRKEMNKYKMDINPNAFFIAIVVNTNDPYRLGRVQIRIPSIHGNINTQSNYLNDDALPWAKPAILNGAGNDLGQFIIPSKGTRVVVSFEYNDLTKPLYFGGIPTLYGVRDKIYNDNPNTFGGASINIFDDDRIKDLSEDTAQQVVYKSFKGATIIIDDQDGNENIKIIDQAGQVIEMGHSGTTLDRRGNKILDKAEPDNYIKISNGTASIQLVGDKIILNGNVETNNIEEV